MQEKNTRLLFIGVPALLMLVLMGAALVRYPILMNHAPWKILAAFGLLVPYILLWILLGPDGYARKAGILIGCLFIGKVWIEELTGWHIRPARLTTILFVALALIAAIRSFQTRSITQGIKAGFLSALLGTLIALCFVFAIDFLFPGTIAEVWKNDPHSREFSNPEAFVFSNSFSAATNRMVVSLLASLVLGTGGGLAGYFFSRFRIKKPAS